MRQAQAPIACSCVYLFDDPNHSSQAGTNRVGTILLGWYGRSYIDISQKRTLCPPLSAYPHT